MIMSTPVRTSSMIQRVSEESPLPVKPRPLRIILYVLTFLSAVAALFLEPALAGAVSRGAISPLWLFTATGVYGVFFLAFAIDRVWLVKKRRYSGGRAFFQVSFGLIFGLLLLPSTLGDYSSRTPQGIDRLLVHPDPEIRVAAVEAVGFRGFNREYVGPLVAKLSDGDARVQQAAWSVLSRWSGRNPGDTPGILVWASAVSKTGTVSAPRKVGEEPR